MVQRALVNEVGGPNVQGAVNSTLLARLSEFLPEAGSWAMVPNTQVGPHLTLQDEFGFCGSIDCSKSRNAFYSWTTMAYDPIGHKWYNCAGGGHADYGGNECYKFDFRDLTWDRITKPAPLDGPLMTDENNDGVGDACPAPTSTPPASHTYDGAVWAPSQGKVLWFGSVGYCRGGMGGQSAWMFDPRTLTWSPLRHLAHIARYARTDMDSETQNIWLFHVNRVYEIDGRTNEILKLSDPGSDLGHGTGVIHPARNEFYLTARGSLWVVSLDRLGEPTEVAQLPAELSSNTGVAYHPPTDKLIFWSGDRKVWSFDAASASFALLPSGGLGPTDADSAGVYGKWIYIPELDVFAGYNNTNEGIWLYTLPDSIAVLRIDHLSNRASHNAATLAAESSPNTGATLAGSPASFEDRCNHPAVILCDPLDTGLVKGVGITTDTQNIDLASALTGKYRDWRWAGGSELPGGYVSPSMDSTEKSSGTGSLRLTIPAKGGSSDGGYLQVNFTPDNSVQFGEGTTFYVQWRQRFSCSLIYVECDPNRRAFKTKRRRYGSDGGGHTALKTIIINAGDHSRLAYPVSSCTSQHLVLNHTFDHAITGYHSCGRYEGFVAPSGHIGGNAQYDFQPGGDNTCYRVLRDPNRKATWGDTDPNCARFAADQWMTFQVQVSVGRWQPDATSAPESNIRLWVGFEGQESILVLDHDFHNRGPENGEDFKKYGKIWLLAYLTRRDPTETHSEAYTWYDELIVSRDQIADPLPQ